MCPVSGIRPLKIVNEILLPVVQGSHTFTTDKVVIIRSKTMAPNVSHTGLGVYKE